MTLRVLMTTSIMCAMIVVLFVAWGASEAMGQGKEYRFYKWALVLACVSTILFGVVVIGTMFI